MYFLFGFGIDLVLLKKEKSEMNSDYSLAKEGLWTIIICN